MNNVFKSDGCWLQNGRHGEAIIKAEIYEVNLSEAGKTNQFFSDLFETVSQNFKKTGQFSQMPIFCILAISETTGNRKLEVLTMMKYHIPSDKQNQTVTFNRLWLCIKQFQRGPCSPPPTRETAGHLLTLSARGWGIRNFFAARVLGISVPQGDPRAFDTRVFERWMSLLGRTRPLSKPKLPAEGKQ